MIPDFWLDAMLLQMQLFDQYMRALIALQIIVGDDLIMDPNATLKIIRELINDGDSADVELVYAFNDLDEWLAKGGALPTDWNQP